MPLFTAVSSSARQLFLLLRCISFVPKAQVQISEEGLRFSVDQSRVMQGFAFLDKGLFTTFHYNAPRDDGDAAESDVEHEFPIFQIDLLALLETLQIFGSSDSKDKWSTRDPYSSGINGSYARASAASAFDSRVLGMSGLCRITYEDIGSPLCITIEEENVKTTCELLTYEPDSTEDIPFNREQLALKVIMRAPLLHDAIAELASANPERITITSSPSAPFFALSAVGPLGSASVEFNNDPALLETFQVRKKTVNTYKFSLIRAAAKAMAAAAKVSIRGDSQGVLSLQFMVEVETGNGAGASFIDFKFVPFVAEDEDGADSEDEEEILAETDDRTENE